MNRVKQSWDLSLILPKATNEYVNRYLKERDKKADLFARRWKKNTAWKKDPRILKKALKEYELLAREGLGLNRATFYFSLAQALRQGDPEIQGKLTLCSEASLQIYDKVRFFILGLSRLPKSTQKRMLSYKGLASWHHLLKHIFLEGRYTLSEETEKAIAKLSTPAYAKWVRMLLRFVSEEESIIDDTGPKTFEELLSISSYDKNEKRRKKATRAVTSILQKHSKTAEEQLNSVLYYRKAIDDLRGFKRPDQARFLSDNISAQTVDSLRDSVVSFYEISHHFYYLKAKLFSKKKLTYGERSLLYHEFSKKITFSKAVKTIREFLKELDPLFLEIFEDMLRQGRIDVKPKKGKRGGAFMSSQVWSAPSYILLNFTGRFEDLRTLVHELGHAIHSELSRKAQDALNWDYPTSLAEVASTFFEELLIEHFLERAKNKQEKRALLELKLQDAVSTVFRQIACYEFEWSLHHAFRKTGYLGLGEINKIFTEKMQGYLGPRVGMRNFELWWIYWQHIRYYFYVYSYAFGKLASRTFISFVSQNRDFMEKVKLFLSLGGSLGTEGAFSKIGIDIQKKDFWKRGLKEIEKDIQKLESLL